ncbi:MAG TPA: hypothetical protein VLK22_00650 [Candidatus Udaeobacter sp.]|nr:hypothetical protein [Candidatus Udaeobacter sp.]
MSIKRQIKFKYLGLIDSLQTLSLPRWLNSGTTRFGLLVIIFFFGIAYVVKTTASATSGYQVHELEKQTASLETEVQKIQVEIADNSSINNISSRVAKLNMVEVSGVKYLAIKNMAVAKN